MRRRRIAAVVLIARVVLALTLLPLFAFAAEDAGGFAGTYEGIGEGIGVDGGGGSSAVTVYAEDLGDTARFTIEVLEYGITVVAEGPVTDEGGVITVPISVDSVGVSGDAMIAMQEVGPTWVLSAEGAGTALGYEGTGSLVAERISTGFGLGTIGEQVGEMFGSIVGGPAKAQEKATARAAAARARVPSATPAVPSATGGTTDAPDAGVVPDAPGDDGSASGEATATTAPAKTGQTIETTPLSPATPEPPLADTGSFAAAGLAAVILVLQIILA